MSESESERESERVRVRGEREKRVYWQLNELDYKIQNTG